MIKKVTYPEHIRRGIRPILRDYPLPKNLRLFGGDTETVDGDPYTVQIHDGRETGFYYIDKNTIFSTFCEWIRPKLREKGVNICYFHNLNFDIRVLFSPFHMDLYEQFNEVKFELDPSTFQKLKNPALVGQSVVLVKLLFGKVNCGSIQWGEYQKKGEKSWFKSEVKLDIYDSFAFTQTSLKKSLKMFGVEQGKLTPPKGLGHRRLKGDQFENYAKQDVVAQYALGERILDFHEEYQVRPSISLSQFASRVFRRFFFDKSGSIQFPPVKIIKAAELSYHAGKNGFYVDEPKLLEDVYELDINSAFPYAMSELPQFVKGEFVEVDSFVQGFHGIYSISGEVLGGKYPLVYDHSFKPIQGKFSETWTTGYELERMMTSPFVIIKKIHGHIWKPGEYSKNSFKEYVEHFYSKKEVTPKSDPHYNFYKIILNGLYGKLVSTIETRSVEHEPKDEKNAITDDLTGKKIRADFKFDSVTGESIRVAKEWKAGSLYNPFIASLITGKVRQMLYDLEVKFEALHSATDSIKTLLPVEKVPGLGGYKIECFGKCYFFRNKLYLHFAKDNTYCGHDLKDPNLIIEDGQHLCKAAYHGYKGDTRFLYDRRAELLETHHLRYDYEHVVGLREGLKRNETPCNFVKRKEILCLCKWIHSEKLCRESGFKCHCQGVKNKSGKKNRKSSHLLKN